MNAKTVVRAFAPGSVGNIGPGLDIMGLALTGPRRYRRGQSRYRTGGYGRRRWSSRSASRPDAQYLQHSPRQAVAKLAGKPEASIEIRISKGPSALWRTRGKRRIGRWPER
jgi:homoserine kinase